MTRWLRNSFLQASSLLNIVKLKLLSPIENNIICNKGSSLDVYTVRDTDSKASRKDSLYLRRISGDINMHLHPRLLPLVSVTKLSFPHLPVEILCVLSGNLQFSLLSYRPTTRSLHILWSISLSSIWEHQPLLQAKLVVHPNQETIAILPTGSTRLYIIKTKPNVFSYDPKQGIYVQEDQIAGMYWKFQIPYGKVMDIVFDSMPTNSIGSRFSNTITTQRKGSVSNPNSPHSSLTPPFGVSSPNVSHSPVYQTNSPLTPTGVPFNGDRTTSSRTEQGTVGEEFLFITTLIAFQEYATQYQMKKIRLELHKNLVKDEEGTQGAQVFPRGSMLLSAASNGIFCVSKKEITFFHQKKKKVIPLELEHEPFHCTSLSEDSFLIIDISGAMVLLRLRLEKDRFNINRISQKSILSGPINRQGVCAFPIESLRKSGSKFGTFVVFFTCQMGDSWIGVLNPDEHLLEKQLVVVKSFPALAPISSCQIIGNVVPAKGEPLPDLIVSSNDSRIHLIQTQHTLQEIATFQQPDVSNLWILSRVSYGKEEIRPSLFGDEFICLTLGTRQTNVLSIPDNLTKSSFIRGFEENHQSLYIASLSEPIVIQVTPYQVNVVNRYTGTLLSEWKAQGNPLPFTGAITVAGFLCVIQNYDTLYLLSCEIPSVGSTNNRLPKIPLSQEHLRSLSDSISFWDSISLPVSSFVELDGDTQIEIGKQCKEDKEKMKESEASKDVLDTSMEDIWDIFTPAKPVEAPQPTIEEPQKIIKQTVQGLLVVAMRHTNTISVVTVPSLATIASYTLDSKRAVEISSIAVLSFDESSFRVLIGLVDGNLLSIILHVTTSHVRFDDSSLSWRSFSSSPAPIKLFHIPKLTTETSQFLVLSSCKNHLIEFQGGKQLFTVSRLSIEETIVSIACFTEERCGADNLFFICSTPKSLVLCTLRLPNPKELYSREVTTILDDMNVLHSAVCTKHSRLITLTMKTFRYEVTIWDLSTSSLVHSTLLPPDVTDVYQIFNHLIQNESLLIIPVVRGEKEECFLVYSIALDGILVERCQVSCSAQLKLISAFGLLLCCTSSHVRGYSWSGSSNQMNTIMEYCYAPENVEKMASQCVSFRLQRVANFMQDGQVQGTQFHLLISSLLENTRMINFIIGKGKSDVKLIGEHCLKNQIIHASEFCSLSGNDFVVADRAGMLSFMNCSVDPTASPSQLATIRHVSSYYIGEPMSMIRFFPSTQKLLLGSIFGSLSFLSPVESSDTFDRLKSLCSMMKKVMPHLGSSFEQTYSEQLQDACDRIEDIHQTRSTYPVPSDCDMLYADYLSLFISFFNKDESGSILSVVGNATLFASSIAEFQGLLK